MSINKNDCMDCGNLELRAVCNRRGFLVKYWYCKKKKITLSTGLWVDAMEDECPDFKYEE